MAVVLAALIMVSTVAPALAAGAVGATSSSPSGMVGLADDQVTSNIPQHAQDRIPSSANAWNPQTGAHATDMTVEITTESAMLGKANSPNFDQSTDDVVLEWTDNRNHEARTVAVDASTLEQAVGHRPTMAYGVHESGDTWSRPITYENGMATWTIPKFSTNSVSFDGNFSLQASPAADGDSYVWNTSDGGENLVVNATGTTNSAWDNESVTGLNPGANMSISPAGNLDPTGPNGNPSVTVTGHVNTENNFGSAQNSTILYGDTGGTEAKLSMEFDASMSAVTHITITSFSGSASSGTVDIYMSDGNADGTWGEGTLVKSNWDPPSSSKSSVTIKLDTPYDPPAGTDELEFVSSGFSTDDNVVLDTSEVTFNRMHSNLDGDLAQRPAIEIESRPTNIKVGDSDETKTLGNLADGETKTVDLNVSTSDGNITTSGTGGSLDVALDMKERTQTVDPCANLNENNECYTGTLSDGETTTITTNDSHLVSGENTLNVSVGSGLSSDAPTPQVVLNVTHDVVTTKSIDYDGEAFRERYGVNKTWAEGGNDAKFKVSWASDRVVRVDDVKVKYYNSSDALDHVDKNPTYTAENGTLTVQLGDIPDGWTTRVIANGSKVKVKNGDITVLDPTTAGDTLNTKIRVDNKSDGFAIAVGGTASGHLIHHLEETSYTGAEEYTVVDASGKQQLRAPKASSGATAYVRTIPVSASPEVGEVHISVTDTTSTTEPQFTIVGPGNGNSVDYTFVEAKHEQAYVLYSKSAAVARDDGVANSPITLTDDDSLETLVFLEDDDGDGTTDDGDDSSDGEEDGSGLGARTSGGIGQTAMLFALALVLAGVWWLSQTRGSGNVTDQMLLVAEALVLGPIVLDALTAASIAGGLASGLESFLGLAGAGLGKAMPLAILVVAGLGYLYLRNRGKPDEVNKIIFRGGK